MKNVVLKIEEDVVYFTAVTTTKFYGVRTNAGCNGIVHRKEYASGNFTILSFDRVFTNGNNCSDFDFPFLSYTIEAIIKTGGVVKEFDTFIECALWINENIQRDSKK